MTEKPWDRKRTYETMQRYRDIIRELERKNALYLDALQKVRDNIERLDKSIQTDEFGPMHGTPFAEFAEYMAKESYTIIQEVK